MHQIEEIAKEFALTIFANYINFVFGTWCTARENDFLN